MRYILFFLKKIAYIKLYLLIKTKLDYKYLSNNS